METSTHGRSRIKRMIWTTKSRKAQEVRISQAASKRATTTQKTTMMRKVKKAKKVKKVKKKMERTLIS